MELRYKQLFEELSISGICPPTELVQVNIEAFRWVFNDIENSRNFLPNFEIDKLKNNTAMYNGRFLDETKKCLRCSISLFTSVDAAKINFNKLTKKHKDNLGYTKIAKGNLSVNDGACTLPNSIDHFSFFESTSCNLASKFSICDILPV